MKTITAVEHLSDSEVAKLEGMRLDESYADVLISGEAIRVRKPNGSPLLTYLPDALPRELCATAEAVFSRVPVGSLNRGSAAGEIDASLEVNGASIGQRSRTRAQRVKRNGTISKTREAVKAPTAIVGYWDRDARTPYCRQTAFTQRNAKLFRRAWPFIRAVDRVFAETVPERYAVQKAAIDATSSDFIIPGTAFTTITVNRSWPTAVHQDDGDFSLGFGVMSVLDSGDYDGGYLVFPKYRVAVDMRRGGVCLADVHEFHGNTPIIGIEGEYLRLSLVFYMRARMTECGSAREESERARDAD